jgi:hypothetical protein
VVSNPVPGWIEAAVASALAREPSGWNRPVLLVRVDEQRLYVWDAGRVTDVYPVSTSAQGVGGREGSLQTPLGLHRVARRIGDGAPFAAVFRGRSETGATARLLTGTGETGSGDVITSRILWLEGLEAGINRGGDVDSFSRFIYIHGTDEEGRIGTAASHGCVRMANRDVIDLFARVPLNSLVLILDSVS